MVYILLNNKKGKTYTGSTNNFRKKLEEHNSNRVLATKYQGLWTPLYIEFYPDEKCARARKKQLKTSTGRRYLKKAINDIIQIWAHGSAG